MNESIYKYFNVGTILWMSYPPATYGQSVEGYKDSLLKVLKDDYFNAIEITQIKDDGLREEVKQLLGQSHMKICYGAQPRLLSTGLNPNDLDEEGRLKAEKTLREGIEKSRNLMTVRLAQDVGMDKISAFAKRTGINDHLPELLSMSLGAGETRLIDLTSAYAEIVNGGKKIQPYLIERIQDRYGRTILKQDNRDCAGCNYDVWENQPTPQLADGREQVFDSLSAYQMTSILEGVATRGSGARLRRLKKHLAGKTGTTNDSKEGWFVGFSPDLVVGTYIGFDEPRTLGRWETGASVALPVFYAFMEEALKDQPDIPFRIPAGIKLVRINYKTGKPAVPGDQVVITEALKPDFDFETAGQRIINGSSDNDNDGEDDRNDFKRFGNSADSENFQLGTQY